MLQAVSVIKSLGGNVKMLVTNPKEEEEGKKKDGTGKGNHKKTLVHAFREKLLSFRESFFKDFRNFVDVRKNI